MKEDKINILEEYKDFKIEFQKGTTRQIPDFLFIKETDRMIIDTKYKHYRRQQDRQYDKKNNGTMSCKKPEVACRGCGGAVFRHGVDGTREIHPRH